MILSSRGENCDKTFTYGSDYESTRFEVLTNLFFVLKLRELVVFAHVLANFSYGSEALLPF